jgi:hypothetical protein
MTLPSDWWTTELEDEPCDGCGAKPSKHQGHGSFTCKACYDARWCPECKYSLTPGHVCPDAMTRAADELRMREFFASIDLEYPEDDG